MYLLSISFLFLCGLVEIVFSQTQYYTYDASFAPTTSNYVRRAYGTAIVIGDYLYYDGGDLFQIVDGNFYGGQSNGTISIDISQSWANSSVEFHVVNKTAEGTATWNRGFLWPNSDNSSFYQWGGEVSGLLVGPFYTPADILAQFDPDRHGGGTWTTPGGTPDTLFASLQRTVGGATSYRGDTWYKLGGYRDCETDPNINDCDELDITGGMVSYNSSSTTWGNTSAAGFSETGSFIWGQMQNVPFGGPAGLNIIFGGHTAVDANGVNYPSSLLGLDRIYIHNPATNAFWNQTATAATGSMPGPRRQFCSIGVSGSNETFEIFMYGGNDPNISEDQELEMSDAIWILSLPSFAWFKAPPPSQFSRWIHTCSVAGTGGSQMIVWGGVNRTSVAGQNATDPWTNGLNVFDLNKLEWKDSYDPKNPTYKTPSIIQDYVAKNGQYPKSWDYPQIQNLFTSHSSPTSSSPTSSSHSSPNSSSPTSSSHSSHTGAIVGGVVGGVIVFAGLGLAWWWTVRSRRKRNAAKGGVFPKIELPTTDDGSNTTMLKKQPHDYLGGQHELESHQLHEMLSDTGAHEADGVGKKDVAPVRRFELAGS